MSETSIGMIMQLWEVFSFKEGHNENAKKLLQQALDIFEENGHPERYLFLESLAEVYLENLKNPLKIIVQIKNTQTVF